jgi:hypothetical protein
VVPLVTVRTVLCECQSTGMEHSYFVFGVIILFKSSLLTYILEDNINENRYIFFQIKFSYIVSKVVGIVAEEEQRCRIY